ncbi:hypothetical protein F4802DRAFT_583316 [Xylaria palmicola]|nr:hypothetical protein F4802DRAFT_583316 [Xylaria palmicola]
MTLHILLFIVCPLFQPAANSCKSHRTLNTVITNRRILTKRRTPNLCSSPTLCLVFLINRATLFPESPCWTAGKVFLEQ